ncbi:hypothetical protein EGW08_015595, partial [Elysia chlorotica]
MGGPSSSGGPGIGGGGGGGVGGSGGGGGGNSNDKSINILKHLLSKEDDDDEMLESGLPSPAFSSSSAGGQGLDFASALANSGVPGGGTKNEAEPRKTHALLKQLLGDDAKKQQQLSGAVTQATIEEKIRLELENRQKLQQHQQQH